MHLSFGAFAGFSVAYLDASAQRARFFPSGPGEASGRPPKVILPWRKPLVSREPYLPGLLHSLMPLANTLAPLA